ncbi:hypothetical protein [Gemmatimonas sp.]|uniref:hypothetical protein n=1 Tax=Gemmatimonas sp. TaxID=1962908 RepID=UPI00286CFAF1|nr:hypothetical protein [Gemmatimonas sp.]
MNPYVRDRINRKLDTLSDERLYQILDYVEFLESKYAEKSAPVANVFTRFAEGVEDKLRAGGVAVSTVSETMGFLNKAMGVLNGVAQTTMTVAGDVVNAAKTAADQVGAPPPPSSAATTQPTTQPGTQPAPPSVPPTPPSAAA